MRTFPDRGRSVPNTRRAEAQVDPLFIDRWSPRAFDPAPLPEEAVATLFEAARWAPSCFNEQPWLFVHGTGESLPTFQGLLSEKNRAWAKNAPLLAVLFARKTFSRSGKPNRWAGFDCGAAWVSLALQARMLGLYAHAMAGFDRPRAHELLAVPDADFDAMAAIAVGMYGDPAGLPENQREWEFPSDRKPLGEVARRL